MNNRGSRKVHKTQLLKPAGSSRNHTAPCPVTEYRVYYHCTYGSSCKKRRKSASFRHGTAENSYRGCCKHSLHKRIAVCGIACRIKSRKTDKACAYQSVKGLSEHKAEAEYAVKHCHNHKCKQVFYCHRYYIFAADKANLIAGKASLHEEYKGSAHKYPRNAHIHNNSPYQCIDYIPYLLLFARLLLNTNKPAELKYSIQQTHLFSYRYTIENFIISLSSYRYMTYGTNPPSSSSHILSKPHCFARYTASS